MAAGKEKTKPMDTRDNAEYQAYLKTDKWKQIAAKRLEIDHYQCVVCGCRGTMTNPLEVHHLSYRYLYHEETRIYEDLASVCHNCHKNVHALMDRITNKDGRRGWKDNRYIPKISVYTLTGLTLQHKEVNEK